MLKLSNEILNQDCEFMGRDRMERDRPGHGNISECKTHTQKKKNLFEKIRI